MNFRFTMNDSFVLNDMPDGWRDLTLSITSNSTSQAIYVAYTSDLVFWGNSWTYLKFFIDGVGICARIPFKIEIDRNDSGNFKFLYQGVIDLSGADIDYERCTVKARIETVSYLDYISARYDLDVYFFNHWIDTGGTNGMKTFDGQDIGTINFAKYIVLHDIATGDQPGLNPLFPRFGYAYKVSTVLTYMLQYITGNKVTAISDLFTKQSFRQGQMLIQFTNPLSHGDVVDIAFTNCFGQRVQRTVTINTALSATPLDQVSMAFVQHGKFTVSGGAGTAGPTYNIFDGSMFSFSEPIPGLNAVRLNHVTPIDITTMSLSSTNGPVTGITEQSLVYGMKNLFMAFNREISTGDNFYAVGSKQVPFKKVFEILDSHFNLGMSLDTSGNNITMRIEPKSYFYNKPQILNVGSVRNIKATNNDDLLIQNLVVGTKGSDANYIHGASGKKQNWTVKGCQVDVTDKDSEGNFDMSSIGLQAGNFPQFFPQRYSDDITFILSTDATVDKGDLLIDPVLSEQYKVRVINTNTGIGVTPEGVFYGFNAGLINYWAIRNHLFSLAGTPQTGSMNEEETGTYFVKNTDNSFTRKNYEFEAIMTDDEAKMCILQPIGKIGFTDSQRVSRSCSLFELDWNVNTCKAKFKVFG